MAARKNKRTVGGGFKRVWCAGCERWIEKANPSEHRKYCERAQRTLAAQNRRAA